jgi:hypothetical protein
MPQYTKAEQETIIRWDEEARKLDIYTCSERVATRLQRRGYALTQLANPQHGWRVQGLPLSCLTFRRIGADVSGKPKRQVSEGLRKFRAEGKRTQPEDQVSRRVKTDTEGAL